MVKKDTAYSWAVLVGVLFTVFYAFGVIKSFGVLLPELREQLATDTWIVGSSVSLMEAWGYTVGISTQTLVMRFGPRAVAVGCGVLLSTGMLVCAFAYREYILLIGILLAGFLFMLENVMVGVIPQYFDKYYNIAVSIYTCATGVGITIVPLVTQALLSIYGCYGVLLLIAGFGFHSIPLGALLHSEKHQDPKQTETIPLIDRLKIKDTDDTINDDEENSKAKKALNRLLTLLKNKPFVARILVPGFVHGYIFNGWMIYIVAFAVANGASLKESAIAASCGGIGVFLTRLSLPYFNKIMNYKHIMCLASCLAATTFVLFTIYGTLTGMSVISIFFGIGLGALGAEIYIVAKDVAQNDQYYFDVIAVFHLFFGAASILSGMITGLIYDMTQSFTISFYILAAVSSIASVSLVMEELCTSRY